MRFLMIGAMVGVLGLGIQSAARADILLDFNIASPTSGTISYAGGNAPLIGSGISVDSVVGLNTAPLNNNVVRNCLGCFLNFTTGGLTGVTPTQWTFGNGGSITMTGTVDLNNNGVIDGTDVIGTAANPLMYGYFAGASPAIMTFGGTFKIAGAMFGIGMTPGLTSYYGLAPTPPNYIGNFNISFSAPGIPPGAFKSTSVHSGNITAETPEPMSIVLLGTVLLCCAAILRKQRKRA